MNVTTEQARAIVRELFPAGTSPDPDDAIGAAVRFAVKCGYNFVGTEHLLFVLADDPGSRGGRVLEMLGVGAAVRRKLRCFEPERRTRWKGRRSPSKLPRCSCGRGKDQTAMVAGPDVCICQACVAHAADRLRTDSAAATS